MKFSLNFLDRWELKLFRKYSENHVPVSKFVAVATLLSSFAVVIITAFIMDMAGAQQSTRDTVSYIFVGASFLATVLYSIRPFMALTTVGSKIGFCCYVLGIYGLLTFIFGAIAFVVVILIIGVLVLWILSLMAGGSGNSDKEKGSGGDTTTCKGCKWMMILNGDYYCDLKNESVSPQNTRCIHRSSV
ncbi:MAG: DUF2254 domain-containing protein [Cytophagaceae bacterium]|jgi:hypothetical protein|nr:DUF2254 domain-containing protein [Cytophagaceae bacterium]